jgi:hypothetical protein
MKSDSGFDSVAAVEDDEQIEMLESKRCGGLRESLSAMFPRTNQDASLHNSLVSAFWTLQVCCRRTSTPNLQPLGARSISHGERFCRLAEVPVSMACACSNERIAGWKGIRYFGIFVPQKPARWLRSLGLVCFRTILTALDTTLHHL